MVKRSRKWLAKVTMIVCLMFSVCTAEVYAAPKEYKSVTKSIKQKETKSKIDKKNKKQEEVVKEESTVEVTPKPESTVEENQNEEKQEGMDAEKIAKYQAMSEAEAQWLWSQQMSNGAFAFYNEKNGSVTINPYFSEIVAISLINYDATEAAAEKIKKYMDWHFAHINTAEEDYNGLGGTIYDYNAVVENGIVVSETSKGSYDSTDSYSALFVKVLADYVKVYGDTEYIKTKKEQIDTIVNVMFATMAPNGYTYAKPDYKIIYLMDNTEVYSGLTAAKYLYQNVLEDAFMYEKINNALTHYNENFNKDWWKGNHYAAVLNGDNSEYTGYAFSWDMFYPCATAQMYPLLYCLIAPESEYAKTVYNGICNAWDWQDMDYVEEGVDVFYWGAFAYLGGLMGDEDRFNSYMEKYTAIIDAGRPYPLYSAEAAMVLNGCQVIQSKLAR